MPDSSASIWKPYEPSAEVPWNLRRVVHLHRRASFAAPWKVLQKDLKLGPAKAIDRLLEHEEQADDHSFESLAHTIGDAAEASGNPARLKAWWAYRMLVTPRPLVERFTLVWHNHFATSNRKVQDLAMMRDQNSQLRKHALAPFGELLRAVVKHPAMLVWLDADSNRKGHPNENLARELMELFTIGVGNYSEQDVRESARALTGWTVVSREFGFRKSRHDASPVTLLGASGELNGDDLIARLLQHPATARRLAWRLCQTLLGERVAGAEAIDELAHGLRANHLSIAWGIERVLRSQLFFSEANLGTRVTSPAEHVIGVLRALELCDPPPSTLLLAEWTARMGQELFYPPNVGGWNEGRTWLSSRTVVARANFAQSLTEGQLWRPARVPDVAKLASRLASATDLESQVVWLAKLLWGHAPQETVKEAVRQSQGGDAGSALQRILAFLLTRPESYLV